MDYYYCSKLIRFPMRKVILKIYDIFTGENKTLIKLDYIYNILSKEFNVKSFNRANLCALLGSSGEVSFNTVKDLYIKYVIEDTSEEQIDYTVLNKFFVQNRTRVINFINDLGLDVLKDMLSDGFSRWRAILYRLSGKNTHIYIKSTKSKLVLEFINQYNEITLLSILKNEESIIEKIEEFVAITQEKSKHQQFKNKINFQLEHIHEDNLKLLTKYFFTDSVSLILDNYNIKTVGDFKNLNDNIIVNLQDYETIIMYKLKGLQFSLKEKLNEEFKLLIQLTNKQNKPNKLWENYVSILENRAKGKTLEVSGQHLELTRERVRQLECKYFSLFNIFNQKLNFPNKILRALAENEFFIQDSDIIKIFPFNPLLFKYFLLNVDNDNLEYSEELGKFYYIDDYRWYDEAIKYTESLPKQLVELDICNYSNELYQMLNANNASISIEDCKKIILSPYERNGDIFSKSKMSLTEMYKFIWKENFPNTVNVYDSEFLTRFKKLYSKTFGDNKEYSDRSIVGILTRIGTLCGRGEYILNDKIFMSDQLASKIYKYIIDSGKQAFLTNSLFFTFKTDLLSEGINNKYFLQGALKQRLADKLYFKRDYVSTSSGFFNIYSEILQYVKACKQILTFDEIKEEFKGVSDNILTLGLLQEGILWFRKKFIHIDNLNLTTEEITFLKDILSQLVSDNEIHHASQLMEYLKLTNNEILDKCYITEQFALFSLIQNLFEDEFEFKRPFIAKKDIVIGNQMERIKEYVYSQDYLTIDELLDFVYENQMHLYSILDCVNSLDGYVLKNESCLVIEEKTNINKYNVSIVEKLIERELGNEEFACVDKLKSFQYFPSEVAWTDWLLYSAINKYGTCFNVIASNNKFRQNGILLAKPIIVKKELGIKDIEQLKQYLKRKTNLNETEFFVYLRNKGLV